MALKSKVIAALLICAVSIAAWIFAGRTPTPQLDWDPIVESGSIKTNFFRGARLSPSELELVVSLAKQSGLVDVSEVSTVPSWPGTNISILVKSVGRVDGRNLSYDVLVIHRTGWHGRKPNDEIVKRAGDFWCEPNGKFTRLLRRYEFNHQRVGVEIGEEVDIAIADKVIPLIGAKKVTLEGGPLSPPELAQLVTSPPAGIERSHSDGRYRLHFFTGSNRYLEFEYGWGRVTVTGVGSIIY